MRIAVAAITKNGAALARRLRESCLADGRDEPFLYLPGRFILPGEEGVLPLRDNLASEIAGMFGRYDGLALVMAAGIVVRLVAPLLRDKREDPAVVVMDEAGAHVISLLSGHAGGANDLALRLAEMTGAEAVITTASDVQGVPAVDTMAVQLDCVIEDMEQAKTVTAAVVNGERISVYSALGTDILATRLNVIPENMRFYGSAEDLPGSGGTAWILITPETVPDGILEGGPPAAVLRPRTLVAGIGCNRGASADEIEGLFMDSMRDAGLSPLSVRNIATIEDKRGEPGIREFARRNRLRVEYIPKERLSGAATPSGRSEAVYRNMGVYGVCEPAALLSAGAETLLVTKKKSENATVAVAAAGSR